MCIMTWELWTIQKSAALDYSEVSPTAISKSAAQLPRYTNLWCFIEYL